MANPITDSYIVRSTTAAGELISQTNAMEPRTGWTVFEDTLGTAQEGVCVQLIDQDGQIVGESITTA